MKKENTSIFEPVVVACKTEWRIYPFETVTRLAEMPDNEARQRQLAFQGHITILNDDLATEFKQHRIHINIAFANGGLTLLHTEMLVNALQLALDVAEHNATLKQNVEL